MRSFLPSYSKDNYLGVFMGLGLIIIGTPVIMALLLAGIATATAPAATQDGGRLALLPSVFDHLEAFSVAIISMPQGDSTNRFAARHRWQRDLLR